MSTEMNIIKDYAPGLSNIERNDISDDSSNDDSDSNRDHKNENSANLSGHEEISTSYNPLDYFDEITSLNKLGDIKSSLKEEALPVPMDYFKRDRLNKLRQIVTKWEEIMALDIAREYDLTRDDLAVNCDNYPEVEKYLFTGLPFEITPNSIKSGVIAGNENFLVLVGSPNKKGYPGRLFLVYSRHTKYDNSQLINAPEPLLMERTPLNYQETMRDISHYDQSLVGQTLESIDGLREIVENFFLIPKPKQSYNHHYNHQSHGHKLQSAPVYEV